VAEEYLMDLYASTNDSSDGVVASLLPDVLSFQVSCRGGILRGKAKLHRQGRLTVAEKAESLLQLA